MSGTIDQALAIGGRLLGGDVAGLLTPSLQQLTGGLFPLPLDWRNRIRPGSFRGVPFEIADHDLTGGRRGVVHEFALRDGPVTEDLGAAARRFTLHAYVVGDDYFARRDALIDAVFNTPGPGTLVHPYLGEIEVQALEGCAVREVAERGRTAVFRLLFVQASAPEKVAPAVDTIGRVLAAAGLVLRAAKLAYAVRALVAGRPGYLGKLLGAALGNLAERLTGLPVGSVAAVAAAARALPQPPRAVVGTGERIGAAFAAAGAAALAAPTPGARDGGLLAMAAWSPPAQPTPPAGGPTPDRAQALLNDAALADLVRDHAVAELAALVAQTEYASNAEALAERDRLLALIDTRIDAAALAGSDDLVVQWRALGTEVAQDLAARALRLPRLAAWRSAACLPALVLAHRLQGPGGDADALASLNGVRHPLFMPLEGQWTT